MLTPDSPHKKRAAEVRNCNKKCNATWQEGKFPFRKEKGTKKEASLGRLLLS